MRHGIAVLVPILALAAGAQAATIGFDPATTANLNPGDPFSLDVVVSDLGGEIVSAYDLDIVFDDAVLDVDSVAFSPALGSVSALEAFVDSDLTPGLLDIAAISILSDAELLALQGGDAVVLATIGLTYQGRVRASRGKYLRGNPPRLPLLGFQRSVGKTCAREGAR